MFEIKKQVLNFNDTLYIIKRMIPEKYLTDKDNINHYKEYLHADTVLRKNGFLFFVEKIEEVEIEEEFKFGEEFKK